MKIKLGILILLVSKIANSQNYLDYYRNVDSAQYYTSIGDHRKAFNCYKYCFKNYKGFPQDYADGIVNYYKVNKELKMEYISEGFKYGLSWNDLRFDLKRNNIPFASHKFKKLYKKNKFKETINVDPLKRLLSNDQKHRKKKSDLATSIAQDSLNTLEFIKLYETNHDLFDRFKTGFYYSEMIWVLMAHQDWKKIEPIFYDLLKDVKNGLIERNTVNYFLERNVITEGYYLTLDTLNNEFITRDKSRNTYCEKMHYSLLGDFAAFDPTIEKRAVRPTNPQISDITLNKVRAFLFLSPIELFRKAHPDYYFYTPEEICERIKAARALKKSENKQ